MERRQLEQTVCHNNTVATAVESVAGGAANLTNTMPLCHKHHADRLGWTSNNVFNSNSYEYTTAAWFLFLILLPDTGRVQLVDRCWGRIDSRAFAGTACTSTNDVIIVLMYTRYRYDTRRNTTQHDAGALCSFIIVQFNSIYSIQLPHGEVEQFAGLVCNDGAKSKVLLDGRLLRSDAWLGLWPRGEFQHGSMSR